MKSNLRFVKHLTNGRVKDSGKNKNVEVFFFFFKGCFNIFFTHVRIIFTFFFFLYFLAKILVVLQAFGSLEALFLAKHVFLSHVFKIHSTHFQCFRIRSVVRPVFAVVFSSPYHC